MQEYNCLCVAAMTCATLINMQTHRQKDGFRLVILIAPPAELKNEINFPKNMLSSARPLPKTVVKLFMT